MGRYAAWNRDREGRGLGRSGLRGWASWQQPVGQGSVFGIGRGVGVYWRPTGDLRALPDYPTMQTTICQRGGGQVGEGREGPQGHCMSESDLRLQ